MLARASVMGAPDSIAELKMFARECVAGVSGAVLSGKGEGEGLWVCVGKFVGKFVRTRFWLYQRTLIQEIVYYSASVAFYKIS